MTNPESYIDMKFLDRVIALLNLVGLAEMAYIEADKHLNVLTWNRGAIKLFNCSEQEAISKKLDMLVSIDKKKLLECSYSEKITKSIIDDNGYKLWYDFLITSIISLKGEKLTLLAARYGGEEFSVVLPQTDSNRTLKVAVYKSF